MEGLLGQGERQEVQGKVTSVVLVDQLHAWTADTDSQCYGRSSGHNRRATVIGFPRFLGRLAGKAGAWSSPKISV